MKSQIKGKTKAGTNSRCPFYRGVHLKEVSVKRESTVSLVREKNSSTRYINFSKVSKVCNR